MRIALLYLFIHPMSGATSTHRSEIGNNASVTNSFQEAMLRFALDLSASFSQMNSKDNFLCSPVSIAAALNVLLLASNGNTKKQIQHCLHYSDADVDEETIHLIYSRMTQSFLEARSGIDVSMANGIFLHRPHKVREEFKETARKYYDAKIFSLDFVNEESSSRRFINKFIEDNTRGRIKDVLKDSVADKLAVLANALYFNGSWEHPFDKSETFNDIFYSEGKEAVHTDFMLGVFETEGFENYQVGFNMISIPYKESATTSFSMFVILPVFKTLKQLEKELRAEHILEALSNMDSRAVILHLPRMKLASDIDLAKVLASLNVTDVFIDGKSDLSNMADNIFINSASHNINIDVTEEGTEFAASTVFFVTKSTEVLFQANRPFLLFIRDNVSKAIILWARILRPDR